MAKIEQGSNPDVAVVEERPDPSNEEHTSFPLLRIHLEPTSLIGIHAAFNAAMKTGLFLFLRSGARTVAECVEKLGLNRRATECVLEVLTKSGIVLCKGTHYKVAADLSEAGLVSVESIAEVIQRQFEHTTHWLKSGEPLAFMDDSAAQRESSYRTLVGDIGRGANPAAVTLSKKMLIRPSRILDVGCGSGVWSLALASNNPKTQVIGLDFPKVLEVFEERARLLGLEKQIVKLPGNMHTVDLPKEPIDLVVIANVLRLEAPENARALLDRFARLVNPGGWMLIVDAFAAGTPEKELQRAVYGLHLALRTNIGRVYSPAEVKTWLLAVGMNQPYEIDLGVHPAALGALLCERPRLSGENTAANK